MLSFIVIFFSSFISIFIEKILLKENNVKVIDFIVNLGIFCFFINFFTITILTLMNQISFQLEESLRLYPAVVVKYMFVSTIMAIIVSLIKVCILKNVGFEIEVKNKKNS